MLRLAALGLFAVLLSACVSDDDREYEGPSGVSAAVFD